MNMNSGTRYEMAAVFAGQSALPTSCTSVLFDSNEEMLWVGTDDVCFFSSFSPMEINKLT